MLVLLRTFVLLCLCGVSFAGTGKHLSPPSEAKCEATETGSKPNQALQDTAQALMFVSAIAYCSQRVILDWQCPECMSGFYTQDVWQIADTTAFIITNADTIVVSFRGTAGSSTWISNLKILAVQWPPTGSSVGSTKASVLSLMTTCSHCAHEGFAQIFEDIMNEGLRKKLLETIQQLPDANIFVTGHSLGGALATLLAYELATDVLTEKQLTRFSVYTFGSPRVFTTDLAMEYDRKIGEHTYRFVHNKDPIPHVPGRLLNAPYEHVGTLIFCPDDLHSCLCKGSMDDNGGDLTTNHDAGDHIFMLGVDTRIFSRSVSLGCQGRSPTTPEDKELDDTKPVRLDKTTQEKLSHSQGLADISGLLVNSLDKKSLVEAKNDRRTRKKNKSLF